MKAVFVYIFRHVTVIKEGASLPPPDPLLKFLVESSAGDSVQCANCDKVQGLINTVSPDTNVHNM